MGREGVEDPLVVGVEPVEFFLRQQIGEDGSLIDGTEGERIELKELTKFGLFVWGDKEGVLDAHAKLACEIDTRLVSNSHTCHQRGWLPFHTDLVGTFVDIKVGAYAVTRAVQIIQSLTPQRLTGQNIKLRAAGA